MVTTNNKIFLFWHCKGREERLALFLANQKHSQPVTVFGGRGFEESACKMVKIT